MKTLSVGDKEKIAFLDENSTIKETYFSTYKYVPVSLDGYFLSDYVDRKKLKIAGGGVPVAPVSGPGRFFV